MNLLDNLKLFKGSIRYQIYSKFFYQGTIALIEGKTLPDSKHPIIQLHANIFDRWRKILKAK